MDAKPRDGFSEALCSSKILPTTSLILLGLEKGFVASVSPCCRACTSAHTSKSNIQTSPRICSGFKIPFVCSFSTQATPFFLTLIDATQDPVPDFTGFVIGAAVAAASQALAGDTRAMLLAVILQDRLVGLQGERLQSIVMRRANCVTHKCIKICRGGKKKNHVWRSAGENKQLCKMQNC